MKSRKFPVFSLMIRELDVESSSHQTASSATEALSLSIVRSNCQITRARGVFRVSTVAEKTNFLKVMGDSRPKSLSANLARPFGSEATAQIH